jgi:hypothetical protein
MRDAWIWASDREVEDQLSIPSHFKEKAIALHLKKIHSTA